MCIRDSFQTVQEKLEAKKPQELPKITPEDLELAELALSYSEAVKEAAKLQIKSLEEIPGWTLKPGRKMIVFTDSAKAEEALSSMDDAWTLKTASQIAKLGLVPELITEKFSEPSLARVK